MMGYDNLLGKIKNDVLTTERLQAEEANQMNKDVHISKKKSKKNANNTVIEGIRYEETVDEVSNKAVLKS
jgi:hypothetical protein